MAKKQLTNPETCCIIQNVPERQAEIKNARVAQLVERDLAKVEAAGSSPVSRLILWGGSIGYIVYSIDPFLP